MGGIASIYSIVSIDDYPLSANPLYKIKTRIIDARLLTAIGAQIYGYFKEKYDCIKADIWLSVIGYRLSVIGYWLSVIGYWLSVISYRWQFLGLIQKPH